MNELIEDLGYRFNSDTLRREYAEINGKAPTPEAVRWFEAVSPFLIIAHKKGLRHESLSGVFPFLELDQIQRTTTAVR